MRLICPNCDAQYEVDDSVIPPGGRDVQCSNCGHTWFQQAAGAEEDFAIADEPEFAPEPAPEMFGETEAKVEFEIETDFEESFSEEPEDTPGTAPDERYEPVDVAPGSVEDDFEEEDAAPVDNAPRRQALDQSLADVLREEAEREMRAREAEAGESIFEDQPDLGLDESVPAPGGQPSEMKEHVARLRGIEAAPVATGARRELLPDIEEINYTLRSTSDRKAAELEPGDITPVKSGFGFGFGLMIGLGMILVLLYVFAAELSSAVPTLEPALTAYVDKADGLRLGLERMTDLLVSRMGD